MPIEVYIEVNGRPIESIHIGRESGGTGVDSVNTYRVLRLPALDGTRERSRSYAPGPAYREWLKGVTFEHTYGDGIEICVEKGLAALNAVDEPTPSED